MSIEVLHHLKAMLANAFARLTTALEPNVPGAQRVQRLIASAAASAENRSGGHLAQIAPLFGTPKFLLAVQTLNNAVASGESDVPDFDSYITRLAAALQS